MVFERRQREDLLLSLHCVPFDYVFVSSFLFLSISEVIMTFRQLQVESKMSFITFLPFSLSER